MRIDPKLVTASPFVSECTFVGGYARGDLDVILHDRREIFREMGGKYLESLQQYESA